MHQISLNFHAYNTYCSKINGDRYNLETRYMHAHRTKDVQTFNDVMITSSGITREHQSLWNFDRLV